MSDSETPRKREVSFTLRIGLSLLVLSVMTVGIFTPFRFIFA
jgi:hypothetical protein